MFQEFKIHTRNKFPFLEKSNILVAVSGGADSVVLAWLCHKMKLKITLAHCNFGLRNQESNNDQAFVKKLANTLKIPIFTKQFQIAEKPIGDKNSIQMAARKHRYQWFEQLTIEHNFDCILTAHHADDSLETFLINLSRGTGIEGLTGIPETNGKVIRPLLCFSKKQIITYAKTEKLNWREDSSNTQTKYLRNKIRHQIIPQLKEINPQFLDNFIQTINYLKGTRKIAEKQITEQHSALFNKYQNGYKIAIADLKKLNPLEAYLFEFFNSYGFTSWTDLKQLLDAQSGKQLFSKTHRLLKDRDYLFLQRKASDGTNIYYIYKGQKEIFKPIHLKFEWINTDCKAPKRLVEFDIDVLKFPLVIRKWQAGDYFYPSGLNGKQKLKQYFTNHKYSLLDKEAQWLLCSDNQIVWVIGKRADQRFIKTQNSKRILQVKWETKY